MRVLRTRSGAAALCGLALAMLAAASAAQAEDTFGGRGRLLLTGGVSTIEGANGGGLTPWALIGGYGTRDEIGTTAFGTYVNTGAYHLWSYGGSVGLYDRVELSFAQQKFNTEKVGGALGLGNGYTFTQNIVGAKVRLFGDAVLEQDSWIPQVAVGAQYKHNNRGALLAAIGAQNNDGVDFYVAATKLFLNANLLVNANLQFTKANQFGILGFGGDKSNKYRPEFEGSVAYLVTRKLAVGAEYRTKPDNLNIAKEDNVWDVFVAYAPIKNVSVTAAYVDLGNIVIADNQHGVYLSLQVGF